MGIVLTRKKFYDILYPYTSKKQDTTMPILPIYNVIFALLIILPMGLIFFSSAFLYNKLCEKELLCLDGTKSVQPIKKLWHFLVILGSGLAIAGLFYYLITNDSFDFTLILLIPPLFIAALCELKNGFTPPISVFFIGLSVVVRIIYYCVFQGIGYGLSIILSAALVFAIVFIPQLILRKTESNPFETMSLLAFSLLGSYFSPVYAVVFVAAVYAVMALGYVLPNHIAQKRKGSPVFTFKIPLNLISTVIFALMLFI